MRTSSRRDFIKKKFLGGVLAVTGIPLLASASPFLSDEVTGELVRLSTSPARNEWAKIRAQFSLADHRLYLNTASLGPSPEPVIDQIISTLKNLEIYARSGHALADNTRQQVATFLHASTDEIALTRNATEGMNIAARSLTLKAGDEILLTTHEHEGGAAPWLALAKDIGATVKLVELDLTGQHNLQLISDSLTAKTKVVSFSHLTCTTGLILPAKEIVDLCRSKGIYSCVDGAQAVGMIPVDLGNINPDFYTSYGHKWLFGPKGTGMLFINKNIIGSCPPVFAGANTSTFDLASLTLDYKLTADREEYGTRNAPLVVGLGRAIDFISAIGIDKVAARGRELANHFRTSVTGISNIEILTPADSQYSASIVTVRIKDRDNKPLTTRLRREKHISVRWIYENNINALRVSFAVFNSIKEVDVLVDALKEIAAE